MACYSPVQAYQTHDGAPVNFVRRGKPIKLPCGGCIGCRADRAKGWAIRVMHEAQMHEVNCFITLTYAPEKLPPQGKLQYSDFQYFMRKLRTQHRADQQPPHVGTSGSLHPSLKNEALKKLRFYMAGEYGEKTERPHYHAALFGIDFPDKIYAGQSESGFDLYTSTALTNIWGLGNTTVQELNFATAAYIARYVMKKRTGKRALEHYKRINTETGEIYYLTPEFNKMSLKPGIGRTWWEAYREDVYKGTSHYKVTLDGKTHKPPRYYDKLMQKEHPSDWGPIRQDREQRAKESPDNTPERLRVREAVDTAKMKQLKRGKAE